MAYQPKSYRKFIAGSVSAAVVASAVAVPVSAAAAGFPDVPKGHWAHAEITALVNQGVITGYPDGSFKPSTLLNRGQAATLFTRALDLEIPENLNVFKDLKATSNFAQYAAAVEKAGIFGGYANGNFGAGDLLTREQMATALVKAFGLKDNGTAVDLKDLDKVNVSHRENVKVLAQHGITTGDQNGNFNPKGQVSRAHFATFLHRALVNAGKLAENPAVESVKAINATTVEVAFKSAVEAEKLGKFTIVDKDGKELEVKNAVVKQTNNKVVVLTTAAQTGDATYTVKLGSDSLGTFKGASAVIPTKIETVVGSQQGIIGKDIKLSAKVTVADGQSKAGIPVTFNIVSDNKNTNEKVEVEALTNENGVAEYSYTRYYKGTDSVVAYATEKSTVDAPAKVYWAKDLQLVVEEAKDTDKLANNAKKLYKVEGEKNGIYAVIFKENFNVKSKDAVDAEITDAIGRINEDGKYTALASNEAVETYHYTSGGARYAIIQLDKDGEGSFNVTGEDVEVTPVVFRIGDQDIDFDLDKSDGIKDFEKYLGKDVSYDRTYLQAEGPSAEFALKHSLAIQVESIGDEDAAAIATVNGKTFDGGRDYKATVKEDDGKLVGKGTPVYVHVDYAKGNVNLKAASSYSATLVSSDDDEKVYRLLANKDGEIKFTLYGQEDAYATPTVFLDNGSKNGELDKKDLQAEGETVYFTDAIVKGATLKVKDGVDGDDVKTVAAGDRAYFVYQSVAQNEKPYYTSNKAYDATFEVRAGANDVDVYNGNTHLGTVKQGTAKTFVVASNLEGLAYISVEGANATSVKVEASSSNRSLPNKEASVNISKYATGDIVTGTVSGWNDPKDEFTVTDSKGKAHFFSYDGASFKQNGSTITKGKFETLLANDYVEVSVTRAEDGKLTFDVLNAGATPSLPGASLVDSVTTYNSVATVHGVVNRLNVKFTKAVDKTLTAANIDGTTDVSYRDEDGASSVVTAGTQVSDANTFVFNVSAGAITSVVIPVGEIVFADGTVNTEAITISAAQLRTAAADKVAPIAGAVAVTSAFGAGDVIGVGGTIDFTVSFSEAVKVTGTPTLPISLDGTEADSEAVASYVSGSGTKTLTFRYTVAAGDTANAGEVEVNAAQVLVLNGGTITDLVGNAIANLATTSGVTAVANVAVAATLPTAVVATPTANTFTVSLGQDTFLADGTEITATTFAAFGNGGSASATARLNLFNQLFELQGVTIADASKIDFAYVNATDVLTVTLNDEVFGLTAKPVTDTDSLLALKANSLVDSVGNKVARTVILDGSTATEGIVITGATGAVTLQD